MSKDIEKLIKQNEIIISLLSRMAFKPEDIKKIVTSKKQNPEKYVEGYNSCDGNRTLTEIAKIVGVTTGTLSPIPPQWEEVGIIREVERSGGKYYRKVCEI